MEESPSELTVWGSGLQGDRVVRVELVGSLWCTTGREDFVTFLVTLVGDLSQVKKLEIVTIFSTKFLLAYFSTLCTSLTGTCVKMMEVETASSITLVTISSMMEVKDWETAILTGLNNKWLWNFEFTTLTFTRHFPYLF